MHAHIFDIDGTLLESDDVDGQLYENAIRAVLGEVRLRADWNDYPHVTDSGLFRDILADNGIAHTTDIEAQVRSTFVEMIDSHIRFAGPFQEIPGARRFISVLMQSGQHRCAYATGGWGASALLKLQSAGFDVQRIPLRSSDHGLRRTDIMLAALDALECDVNSITYYGDARWDERACRDLGWRFRPVGRRLGGITSFSVDE